jgi:hypothetical protein
VIRPRSSISNFAKLRIECIKKAIAPFPKMRSRSVSFGESLVYEVFCKAIAFTLLYPKREPRNHFAAYKNHFGERKNHFAAYKNHFGERKNHFGERKNHFAAYKNHFAAYKNHFAAYKNHFAARKNHFGERCYLFFLYPI